MRPPARVGQRLAEILTPSLIVSLPALEANDAAMRASLRGTGVNLRPHTKAHKSSDVARWQMARAGPGELSGFCAQTLAEAETLAEAIRAEADLAAPPARPGRVRGRGRRGGNGGDRPTLYDVRARPPRPPPNPARIATKGHA